MKQKDGVLRVGGIGTGRIFQYSHIPVYPRFFDRVRLVGFYDIDKPRALQACEKYRKLLEEHAAAHPDDASEIRDNLKQLTCHDSLDSLLAQVDVVDICTHARGRMPSAMAAFEQGVSAMSEKPMARTWTETDRACRAYAQAEDVTFQLNDDDAFSLLKKTLHDILESGAIGNVQTVTMVRGSKLDSRTVLKLQANALENGGGCLMDYGTHGLAGAFYMLGSRYRPVKVEAVKIGVLHRHRVLEDEPFVMEVDDNARFKVMMEDSRTGSWLTVYLEATWCGAHLSFHKDLDRKRSFLQIVGDAGIIETAQNLITIKDYHGGTEELPLREMNPEARTTHVDMYRTFLDSKKSGSEPDINLEFGSDVIATCGAAYLSALQGGAVSLEDFKDFSRGYVKKYGDNEKADDAIVLDLLKPYRLDR